MNKPTILFMNRAYPPARGATGRLLKDLVDDFINAGWQVSVVTSGQVAGETKEENGDLRIIRVKGTQRPKNMFSYIWTWLKMLMAAMRLKSHDIVVSMSDPPLIIIAGQIVSKFKKSKHINWCQDLYPDVLPALGVNMPNFLMKWLTSLRIRAMKKCYKVVVCGRCMARYLRIEGINIADIKIITNWPDIELTDCEALGVSGSTYQEVVPDSKVRPFEKQLKTEQRFRVLYAGNMGLSHPITTILEAAEILQNQNSDIEFVFVGDGVKFDYIAQQRSAKGLDNLRLLPYQPAANLREIMESGDVHLITLKDEAAGFVVPCKLYSALAVARPCVFVGPNNCETAKVISDFEAGFVVAQGDTENLVNALSYLRDNSEAWFAAHQGAVNARDVFTPQNSMEQWQLLANDALKK